MRETEVQQPKVTATFSFWISSRAFSANSGQFEAGSTTTGSSLRPSRPPCALISSMVISATSLSDVSLMAIVPESECRMPTLIGPVSSALAAGAAAAAGAAGASPLGCSSGAGSAGFWQPAEQPDHQTQHSSYLLAHDLCSLILKFTQSEACRPVDPTRTGLVGALFRRAYRSR